MNQGKDTYKILSAISDASHLGLQGYSVMTPDLMGMLRELKCYSDRAEMKIINTTVLTGQK